MPKDKKFISKINNILHEKTIIFLGLFLTLSLSFLVSILYNAKTSEYYTLRILVKQTLLFSLISFWIIFFLIYRQKEKINSTINKNILPGLRKLLSSKGGVFTFMVMILALTLFLLLIIPNVMDYKRPIFKYDVTIKSDDSVAGSICIFEIRNTTASLLTYNETVKHYQESGDWEEDIDDCIFYLGEGKQGEITFENIGSIKELISIHLLKGPDQGKFDITSSFFGFNRFIEIFLDSEEDDIQTIDTYLGPMLLRNITDTGLALGFISILLILYIVVPNSIVEKTSKLFLFLKRINEQFFRPMFLRVWELLDQKRFVIPALFLLYLVGVLYSVFVINPMAFGPSHLGDELRYWNTALSLSNGTFKAINYYRYPPVYPLSLAPAFLLVHPLKTYEIAKLLNALYITSVIFPGYLLIRKFEKRNVALVTSALLLLNPAHLIFPGRILSENVFYPLFMWALLLAFTNIFPVNKRNRIIESLLLGISLGLLFLTRYIALVLIPAMLLVWWLRPFKNEKPPFLISIEKIIHVALILLPILLMAGIWIKVGVNEGLRVKDMIGLFIAEVPDPGQLTFGRLIMWTIFYCSYMVLLASPYIVVLLASLSKFKLKDWNHETNRWIIALAIVISALLVACIRHSWRIPYNYPSPQKLQGRYILYFGPLFLITTFAMIRKSLERTNSFQIFIYSSFLIMISYSFLNLGFIYLDGPMRIAISSPDSIFLDSIGAAFILYPLANTLLNSILLKNKRRDLLMVMTLFLFGFAIFGNMKIVQQMSEEVNQLENSQIFHLLFKNEELMNQLSMNEQTKLEIEYPSKTRRVKSKYWENSLNFYRIPSFSLSEDDSLDEDKDMVFQARCNDSIIKLLRIDEEEYLDSTNPKYSYRGVYYEYLEQNDIE